VPELLAGLEIQAAQVIEKDLAEQRQPQLMQGNGTHPPAPD
jgi:hypothetical protein